MAKLDELGLKRLIENIDKNLNLKVNNIKDTLADNVSFTQDILKTEWELVEGSYKYTITHPLKTQRLAVTAIDTVTKDRIFIHDKAISDNTVELEIDSPQDVTVIIINGSTEIKALELPFDDKNTSTLTTWSSSKIQSELDKKSTDAKSTTFDNSLNGMTSTTVQGAIEENNASIKAIDAEFDKPVNIQYSTANGVKEFECKDGYIDNIYIEGKTLINIVSMVVKDNSNPDGVVRTRFSNLGDAYNNYSRTQKGEFTLMNHTDKIITFVGTNPDGSWAPESFYINPYSAKVITLDGSRCLNGVDFQPIHGWSNSDLSIYNSSMYSILEGNHPYIPYFEGLKSVGQGDKIEVLNYDSGAISLYDRSLDDSIIYGEYIESNPTNSSFGKICSNTLMCRVDKFIEVEPNSIYFLPYSNGNIVQYDNNYDLLKIYNGTAYVTGGFDTPQKPFVKLITSENTRYIKVAFEIRFKGKFNIYKTTNFDKKQINTTLRSLPNGTKDEIVKQGGKYYKVKRCGEIVLNGGENWTKSASVFESTNTLAFHISSSSYNCKIGSMVLCDKLNYSANPTDNTTVEYVNAGRGDSIPFVINILKSKLTTTQDLAGFKTWLSQNPITVVYELATPIIEEIPNFNPRCFDDKTTLLLNSGVVQAEASFEVTNSTRSELEVLKGKISDLDDCRYNIEEPLTYINGWVADTTYGNSCVRRGDIVIININISGGVITNWTNISKTIDEKFRPKYKQTFNIFSENGASNGIGYVLPTGSIQIFNVTTSTYVKGRVVFNIN